MPKRPPGRPKAAIPRDVFVGVRLTEAEADQLCRIAGEQSRSAALRYCLQHYLAVYVMSGVPDTPRAMIARELRKARRAKQPYGPDLVAQIGRALQASGEDLAADAAAPVG
jgi:hypothetical protein